MCQSQRRCIGFQNPICTMMPTVHAQMLGAPQLMSASTGLRDVKDWRITNNENALMRNGG